MKIPKGLTGKARLEFLRMRAEKARAYYRVNRMAILEQKAQQRAIKRAFLNRETGDGS